MIEAAGYVPTVVEYRVVGWTHHSFNGCSQRWTQRPATSCARRERQPPKGLLDGASDRSIIEAMIAHPILVNRPIVVTPKGTKLCRPSEVVLELLESRPASFTKEDGEVVR
jgi:arsenate reductase